MFVHGQHNRAGLRRSASPAIGDSVGGAVWCGVARRGAARRGVAWRGAARRGARRGARRSAWRAARRDCGANPREAFPDREKLGRPHFPRIIFGRPFANGDVTAKCHADIAAVIIIVSMRLTRRQPSVLPLCSCANWVIDSIQAWLAAFKHEMDTLGIPICHCLAHQCPRARFGPAPRLAGVELATFSGVIQLPSTIRARDTGSSPGGGMLPRCKDCGVA